MTPDDLARIHAAAFTAERPWSAPEFADLLKSAHVTLYPQPHGFALTRTVAGESELLTLAVHPDHQRRGIARVLTTGWLTDLPRDSERAFLEVASDNKAAQALYISLGFQQLARRRAYYARKNGTNADACVMAISLTPRPAAFSTGPAQKAVDPPP